MDQSWRDRLISIFLIHPTSGRSRVPLVLWSTLAAISVTLAIIVALQPGQLGDLAVVRGWLHYWLTGPDNPYRHFQPQLDYPPVAFLVLWPLSLPSDAALLYWFLPCAIALTALAVWTHLRWVSDRLQIPLSTAQRVTLVAMVLAGSGTRTGIWLGQTMAISLLFGALAMRYKRSRPWLAALCLALCGFKLHIAAGFGLAILLVEGIGVVLAGAAITIGLSWLFAATIGESLYGVGVDYFSNLLALYNGPGWVRGFLSVRFVLHDMIGHDETATRVYLALAIGSLAAIVVLARRRDGDVLAQVYVSVACLLWSLAFLPHQLYNSLMVAPALFLLMWPESGLIRSRSIRLAAVSAYVLFGVIDPPRIFRLMLRWVDSDLLFWMAYDLSPIRPFALFLLIMWRLYERPMVAAPIADRPT